MNNIKIKAWSKKEKKFLNVKYFSTDTTMQRITGIMEAWDNKVHSVINAFGAEEDIVLVLFTGFTDKNNKEVYDGDIIQARYGEQKDGCILERIIGKVAWHGYGWYFDFQYNSKPFSDLDGNKEIFWKITNHMNRHDWFYKIIDIEVIGNIYENRKLLEWLPYLEESR